MKKNILVILMIANCIICQSQFDYDLILKLFENDFNTNNALLEKNDFNLAQKQITENHEVFEDQFLLSYGNGIQFYNLYYCDRYGSSLKEFSTTIPYPELYDKYVSFFKYKGDQMYYIYPDVPSYEMIGLLSVFKVNKLIYYIYTSEFAEEKWLTFRVKIDKACEKENEEEFESVSGVNYCVIGGSDKKYPCTDYINFSSNADFRSDLSTCILRNNESGYIVVETETDVMIRGELIIYLENGETIKCLDKKKYDHVDGYARNIYSLTKEEMDKLKETNIKKIRYTLKCLDCMYSTEEGNFTASNKEDSKINISDLVRSLFN
ncbi:MAG: hypothetical protein ACO1O6_06900 [Bacteroidota bacterium]